MFLKRGFLRLKSVWIYSALGGSRIFSEFSIYEILKIILVKKVIKIAYFFHPWITSLERNNFWQTVTPWMARF